MSESIPEYLQQEEVRERLRRAVQRMREEVTVTIGRAAELLGFSENQLRDWEARGLLRPERSERGIDRVGQRNYPLAELEKLAIIRELLNAGYSISKIPAEVDVLWSEIDEAFSAFFSQSEQQMELNNIATLQLRIAEEPLTTQNLTTIISSVTTLHTKCWLILSGRLADLVEYTQTHDPHLTVEANLVIAKITHNSPADIKLNVNTDISPQSLAEALKIGIDAIMHTPLRHEEAKLKNQSLVLQMKLKEQKAQSSLADQEQTRQIEAQKAELDRKERQLELEEKQLVLEQRRLEIQEQRLEIEKKRIEYALETASRGGRSEAVIKCKGAN